MFPIRNRSRWVGYLKKATRAVDGDADYLTYQVVIPWMPTQDPIKLGGIIGAKMVVQEDQDNASSFKVSVALTLSEALFLQGRGVLKVLLDETVEPPSLGTSFPLGSSSQSSSRESELCCCELWRIGMNSAEHGGGEAFGIITAAEMYFRKKGFLVGPGLLFGGHLALYRRPRAAAHSSFVVRVVRARAAAAAAAAGGPGPAGRGGGKEEGALPPPEWAEVQALTRVMVDVKKALLICYVKNAELVEHLVASRTTDDELRCCCLHNNLGTRLEEKDDVASVAAQKSSLKREGCRCHHCCSNSGSLDELQTSTAAGAVMQQQTCCLLVALQQFVDNPDNFEVFKIIPENYQDPSLKTILKKKSGATWRKKNGQRGKTPARESNMVKGENAFQMEGTFSGGFASHLHQSSSDST